MKTKTITLPGPTTASAAALRLINRSQWFAITPLPNDYYELEVKEELALIHVLDGIVNVTHLAAPATIEAELREQHLMARVYR